MQDFHLELIPSLDEPSNLFDALGSEASNPVLILGTATALRGSIVSSRQLMTARVVLTGRNNCRRQTETVDADQLSARSGLRGPDQRQWNHPAALTHRFVY